MIVPFAEFAPDRAGYDASASDVIKNVIPRANGYSPIPALTAFSEERNDIPRSAFLATQSDGTYHFFAHAGNIIAKLDFTDSSWNDLNSYPSIGEEVFRFNQFGDYVVATAKGIDPQVYQLGVSTLFTNLAGNPPQFSINAVVGDFLVLANGTGSQRTLRWSGLNNIEWWTIGDRSADRQIFPDGGDINGVVGFERGAIIFQKDCIREMQPALGTDFIFTFRKTEENRGCAAPRSIVSVGRQIFYYAKDGFFQYGEPSTPIGDERVDKWFQETANPLFINNIEGALDPVNKVIYWRFASKGFGSKYLTDKVLIYHYGVNKWSTADVEMVGLFPVLTPSYTLDALDGLGYTLDTLPFPLDSAVWAGGRPLIGGFVREQVGLNVFRYKLGFFNGTNMEATMETADIEFATHGRTFINGFRPISDASNVFGRAAGQDRHGQTRTWKDEFAVNRTGIIPARQSARLHRFRTRIPGAEAWNHAHGVDPVIVPQGNQ